jgi:hypothetical protein
MRRRTLLFAATVLSGAAATARAQELPNGDGLADSVASDKRLTRELIEAWAVARDAGDWERLSSVERGW